MNDREPRKPVLSNPAAPEADWGRRSTDGQETVQHGDSPAIEAEYSWLTDQEPAPAPEPQPVIREKVPVHDDDVLPKPPEPKEKSKNILGMAIGIPLGIAIVGFIIFVVVATAFRFAGTVGDAFGLPPAIVTIGAILLAIFVLGYFFNQFS